MRSYKSIRVTNKIPPSNHLEIYLMAKQIDDLDSEGSFVLAVKRVCKYFFPSYRQYYYESLKSLEDFYEGEEVNNLLRSENVPDHFQIGFSLDFECFKSIYDTGHDGIVPMPYIDDRSLGRHSVKILGVNEDRSVVFINSWGDKWGHSGIGQLSYDYMKLYTKEIFFDIDANVGITDEKIEKLKDKVSAKEYASIWLEKNKRDFEDCKLNGKKLNIVWYTLVNMAGLFVEILDLRTLDGNRIGWAHLIHLRTSAENDRKICLIDELFVWPTFRRKGFGSLLENYCVRHAQRSDAVRIQIPLYEMDDLKQDLSPVRLFATKIGYNFVAKNEVMPCINGIAEKNI